MSQVKSNGFFICSNAAYRKSGNQDLKVGPGTQDPEAGPSGRTLGWDTNAGP